MNYLLLICKNLLKKYNNSKKSIGEKTNKRTILNPIKEIKNYTEYDVYNEVNKQIRFLKDKNIVSAVFKDNGDCEKVYLIENDQNINYLNEITGNKSKKSILLELNKILSKFQNKNEILNNFCDSQRQRLLNNSPVEFFKNNFKEFEDILTGVDVIYKQKEEVLIRNLSIKIYNDSKKLDVLKNKISSLMFKYGNYENIETVFAEHFIEKTPTYIYIKGNIELIFENNRKVNLVGIENGIGVCSYDLKYIKEIRVFDKEVYTIENITSFYDFKKDESAVVYLGGFHNNHKRKFLTDLYDSNKNLIYYHFGDIDAGGLYIYLHLVEQTKIPFNPYYMDKKTLLENRSHWRNLTENDIKRLNCLKSSSYQFIDLINFMLSNNCKLEQESITL